MHLTWRLLASATALSLLLLTHTAALPPPAPPNGQSAITRRSAYETELAQQQQQHQQQQPTFVQHPPHVNPLLKQANTFSVGLLFMLLVWRNLGVYELADQFVSLRMRALTLPPLIAIMIANLAGFLINVMKPQGFKNQLKVILAVNTVREWIEMVYNIVVVIGSSRYSSIPRDVYIGKFFMNVWWIAFCVSFSKSRWVLSVPPFHTFKNSAPSGTPPNL